MSKSLTAEAAARLACPRCRRGGLAEGGTGLRCTTCGRHAAIIGGVVDFDGGASSAYFDARVDALNATTDNNWAFSYAQQVALLGEYLDRARTILDVGCGSRLPYRPGPDAFVIGVDPSADALRANGRLNLRVRTSAVQLPVASESIDLLVCFYSLHHMIGHSVVGTRRNVVECLRECARVLAPGGALFIAENNPRGFFRILQRLGWAAAKRVLGPHLDMFFWSRSELDALLVEATGRPSARSVVCDTSPFAVISPLFAVPRIKVFRFMHPLHCSVAIWNKDARTVPGN